ncbi:hypothetical protein Ancab_027033 [Ancistrocladus abbreviatus]
MEGYLEAIEVLERMRVWVCGFQQLQGACFGKGGRGAVIGSSWAQAVANFLLGCQMDTVTSFWQLGDELRGDTKISDDHKWLMVASKLAEETRSKGKCMNNLDPSKGPADFRSRDRSGFQEDNKFESLNFNLLNSDWKVSNNLSKGFLRSYIYTMNAVYQKNNGIVVNVPVNKCSINNHNIKEANNSGTSNNDNANDKDLRPYLQHRRFHVMWCLVAASLSVTTTPCKRT